MADKTNHIIWGFVVLVPLCLALNYFGIFPAITLTSLSFLAIITFFSSVSADIDQPGSTINRIFYVVGGFVIIWAFIKNNVSIGIMTAAMMIFFRLVTHRRMVHTVLFGIILSIPFLLIGVPYFIVSVAMYITHLIVDGEFSLITGDNWK